MNNRDPFFDNAKFMLIFLVILGHLPMSDHIGGATVKWIFSFHMPLFIFISGYFTRISDNLKFWKGIIRFIETLVVFTIIHLIIFLIQGKSIGLLYVFINPRWTLWYLMSLIWWRIMLFFTPHYIRNNHILLIVISVVLSLGAGWIPLNSQLSFQRTFAFLPFFVMGYIAGTRKKEFKRKIPLVVVLVVLSVVWCVFYNIGEVQLLFQDTSYMNQSLSPIQGFIWRGGWLFLATLMSYCFLCVVPRRNYYWTQFGRLTLFIYLYHSVILSWRFIIRDEFNLPTTLLWSILYTAVVLCTILLMSKIRLFHFILNPVSYIVNKSIILKKKTCLILFCFFTIGTISCSDKPEDEVDATESLFFLGDSIIDFWKNVGDYFPEYICYNYGWSAKGIDTFLGRVNVKSLEGKVCVLEIGTNDMRKVISSGNVDEYVEHYVDVLISLKSKQIYLLSLLPRNRAKDGGFDFNSHYPEINRKIQKKVEERMDNVIYVPIYDYFLKDDKINSDYTYDGLHPNEKGYEVIAMVIRKYIVCD
ncbi:MAG: acyltransferase family protein [Prevotella sp.]|nr:acyltransferase family protein [Prevotella sp.]